MWCGGWRGLKLRAPVVLLWVIALASGLLTPGGETTAPILIEEVIRGGAAESAGLKPGDTISAWSLDRSGTGGRRRWQTGPLCDFEQFLSNEASRSASLLRVRRGGKTLEIQIKAGIGGLLARPRLDGAGEAEYAAAAELLRKGEGERANRALSSLASSLAEVDGDATSWWYLLQVLKSPNPGPDEVFIGLVEKKARADRNLCVRIRLLEGLGDFNRILRRPERAKRLFSEAVRLREERGEQGISLSLTRNRLGVVLRDLGDLDGAEKSFRAALEIQERQIPGGALVSDTLTYIGDVAWKKGEFPAAETAHMRALEIRRGLDPESLKTAASLNNLGILAWEQGDGVKAEKLQRESLLLKEKKGKEDLGIAASLNNLAVILKARGDLAASEVLQRRSIAIREKEGTPNPSLATNYMNLASLLHARGDLEGAIQLSRKSLAIHEKGSPGNREHSKALGNLGVLLADFGDYGEAEAYLIQAIQAYEKSAPESPDIAGFWFNLGLVKEQGGDRAGALRCLEDAWVRYSKIAPEGTWAALCLDEIAAIRVEEGKLAEAEGMYRTTLPVWQELSPGSSWEAGCLHALGYLAEELGRPADAVIYYCRAIESLESQRKRLGGSHLQRAAFGTSRQVFYRRYADLLARSGESARALEILERGRARVFLEMLSEREMAFNRDLPPEIETRWRILEVERQRLTHHLAGLALTGELGEVQALKDALSMVDSRRRDVLMEIRAHAPRLSALQDPVPLSVPEIGRVLEPGTLLASYSVGESDTLVFTMRSGWPAPHWNRIPVGRGLLGTQVRRFRRLIEDRLQMESHAARLGTLLLGPILREIRDADRLLILPDGPLYYLPFAALRIPTDGIGEEGTRYLVEERALHFAPSATVWGELLREESSSGGESPVTVFAVLEDSSGAHQLGSIPGVLDEADAVAAAFPEQTKVYKGPEATADHLEAIHSARFAHFACHGILDDAFPLDSALLLSAGPPGGGREDDGLLHAWEILEKVRLKAQMVVLSACNSGMGKEMSGEGIIGLTRAFQYSGARSVLSTLWSIEDMGTARLMGRFYGELARGKSKDEALRVAQITMIRDAHDIKAPSWSRGTRMNSSHPFYWGGFILNGCR